jgi:hypothetical protein
MYAGNTFQRVSVDEQLGRSIGLGEGVTVQIAEN